MHCDSEKSQCSVVPCLERGEMFDYSFIVILLLSFLWKDFEHRLMFSRVMSKKVDCMPLFCWKMNSPISGIWLSETVLTASHYDNIYHCSGWCNGVISTIFDSQTNAISVWLNVGILSLHFSSWSLQQNTVSLFLVWPISIRQCLKWC